MFHYFKGLNDFEYDLGRTDMWSKFLEVNDKFAEMIKEIKQEKEMIWIHDNYLIMVPIIVRRQDLNANIGFFQHSPFPSSDIFKMFP
jgi:trehalose 6-phosphate synthase/phosphatase